MTTYKVGQVLTNKELKTWNITLIYKHRNSWLVEDSDDNNISWTITEEDLNKYWTPQEEKPQIEELNATKKKYLLEDVPTDIFNITLKINELVRKVNELTK